MSESDYHNINDERLPINIEDEMRKSYLDYAMSVIIGRALPDVRDGLKPVHRRILYGMYEQGSTAGKAYKKSARIVGDVMGKFHPHGDSAIYDAVVRMAQDFSMRYELVDGQGNFGSLDGDNPAAMRYTEVRLTKLAEELLRDDIDKETVDWVPNYDGSIPEPSVLPAKFPNLLVNGSSGIAVGMATNIPPHNLGEVVDACLMMIQNPKVTWRELMAVLPGPDFPTAGFIFGVEGIKQAYGTGRGIVQMRARAAIETTKKGDRQQIVVTEIPYMTNKARLIEKIAELVRDKRIEGISDLRDESDREGIRIVIELKRAEVPEVVLNKDRKSVVVGGTRNQQGAFRFRATKVGADTALAKIVAMVRDAQSSKAPAQRLADLAGKYLVIVALASGLLTFAAWMMFGGEGVVFALSAAVAAVVIACPDALALATPTAITVGVGRAARGGVLFRNATVLEATARVDLVVFDKTGTLTEGRPSVTDIIPAAGVTEVELLRLAAAADAQSEHPLAVAVVEAAKTRAVPVDRPSEFEAIPGYGVRASVGGRPVLVGNRKLLERYGVAPQLEAEAERLRAEAKTALNVAADGRMLGLIAVADRIRPTARDAVAALHHLGVRVLLLTGDSRATAEAVARTIGIDEVRAEVLPADKAAEVRRLEEQGRRVAMVGDGVNDAPALAAASVGIAIGAGTDVAIETAGVILMKDNPADVPAALTLARRVRRKIKQNLFWAAIYNVVAIPLAAGVLYPSFGILLKPAWAALAMSASTVTVTVNALLLPRIKTPRSS